MNGYNIYIEASNDVYSIYNVEKDDLERIVQSYSEGDNAVFVDGERYQLQDLKTIKIFESNIPWDKILEYLNTPQGRKYHQFSKGGKVGLSIQGHHDIGVDKTRDFIKGDYGEKTKKKAGILVSNTLNASNSPVDKIENLFKRFHSVVNQLLQRRNESGMPRATLQIKDEYDVQDLLHALLRIYFNDIRAEEWNPSYAGGSKRSDFLLKNEQIIIEVKKTRQGLKGKEVGEQLIIDIENYRNHKDCKIFMAFIYDPENLIANPKGLENDLSKLNDEFKRLIYIFP